MNIRGDAVCLSAGSALQRAAIRGEYNVALRPVVRGKAFRCNNFHYKMLRRPNADVSGKNVHYTHLQFATWGICEVVAVGKCLSQAHIHTHTYISNRVRGGGIVQNPDELIMLFENPKHTHTTSELFMTATHT